MDSSQLQQVQIIYGEILGIFTELPNAKDTYYTPAPVAEQFNNCINDLSKSTHEDYSRFKLTQNDMLKHSDIGNYDTTIVRTRIGSVVRRLEANYGFDSQVRESPMIITVNNNNQMTVTVTPIREIIQSEQDNEIKDLLLELREALHTDKKSEKTSSILSTLQQKSWEVFIKVLPYVLEQIGKHS